VFATDGYDLKIDIPTAAKFARSIADQLSGRRHTDLTLRRTFKVFSSRKVEVVLTRPAAQVIMDAVLDRGLGAGSRHKAGDANVASEGARLAVAGRPH
jgi:hypothetical protein